MTFWEWAVTAYGRPGVAEACLELQDRHGQSVPYLLWAAWAAQGGYDLDPEGLRAGAELAARWEAMAVGPLRAARRRLKASMAGVEDGPREALRDQVKAVELQAERVLIEALQGLARQATGSPQPVLATLIAATQAWSTPAPSQALLGLAMRLG